MALNNPAALKAFEEEERSNPTPRKLMGDHIIYQSRGLVTSPEECGVPTLCDFGEARFGRTTYTDLIQPEVYRAPEVILDIPWNEKVDIWSIGVMV